MIDAKPESTSISPSIDILQWVLAERVRGSKIGAYIIVLTRNVGFIYELAFQILRCYQASEANYHK